MSGGSRPSWTGQQRAVRWVGRSPPAPSVSANISPASGSCSPARRRPRTRSSVSSLTSCWWCPPSVSSPPRLSSSLLSSEASQDQPVTSHLSLYHCRTDRRATARKLAENNRNWTLFAAQMSFVILARQHSTVSQGACQFFGIVIHFLYLSFFSWTGGSIKPVLIVNY